MNMLFLTGFSVLNPSFGLFFWTTLIFVLVWLFLSRFFKTIAQALEDRENFIDGSLSKAKEAEDALKGLEAKGGDIVKAAEKKALAIIQEAESIKKKKIAEGEARGKQQEENILKAAKQDRDNREKEMEQNIQNQIGQTAIAIAKKLLDKQFKSTGDHEAFVKAQINNLKGENNEVPA